MKLGPCVTYKWLANVVEDPGREVPSANFVAFQTH
jgi:hypothetical protein